MFIIDDILLFPARSLMFIFREIQNAAQQEVANAAESIRVELAELYMMLETGRITEEEFDAREEQLLQLLDKAEIASTDDDDESQGAN